MPANEIIINTSIKYIIPDSWMKIIDNYLDLIVVKGFGEKFTLKEDEWKKIEYREDKE